MNFAQYQVEKDGLVVCEPCLCVSLFSDLSLDAPGSPDMLGPYRAFLSRFSGELSYTRLSGNQMHPKSITAADLQALPSQMSDDSRRKRGGIVAELRSGKSADERRAPSFDFDYSKIGRPHTSVRACLPLPWFETAGIAGVMQFLRESLVSYHLQAGYVGFSFSWEREAEDLLNPYFFRWLQLHHGLMEPMFSHSMVSHLGLVDIGWITLLGKDYVARLGGADELRHAVAKIPDSAVEDLPLGSIAIRLQNAPRLGDSSGSDLMLDYRALGRLLSPLRDRQGLHDGMAVAGFDDDRYPGLREAWIDRFFRQ